MDELYRILKAELYDENDNEITNEDYSLKFIVGDYFYETMKFASDNTRKTMLKQYLKNASNRELTDSEDGWVYWTISGLTLAVKVDVLEPREIRKDEVL